MNPPRRIQNGINAIHIGVEIILTAVTTVVSDTAKGFDEYLLTSTSENNNNGVLAPGTGKTPNHRPKKTRMNLSVHVIS